MALSDGWLKENADTMNAFTTTGECATVGDVNVNYADSSNSLFTTGSYGFYYHEPYPWSYTVWKEWEIELTMSEVEHLRSIALKDKKLRTTLKKFTPHIKVKVDFPAGR